MPKIACYQCTNLKFGLVRYYLRGKVFCKISCRNSYVAGEPRKLPPQAYKPPEDKHRFDVV